MRMRRRAPSAAQAPDTPFTLGRVGMLLLDGGISVTDVRDELETVAERSGQERLAFSVLPDLIVVSDRATGRASVVGPDGGGLSFHQAAHAMRLVRALQNGTAALADVAERIRTIRAETPARPALRWIAGSAAISIGLAAVMRTPWWAVLLALVVGAVVGAVTVAMERLPGAAAITPFVAALASTTLVGFFANIAGYSAVPLFAVCAPVAILVPGSMITNALLELTATDIITGSARLASGVIMLGFMAVGIAGGAALTGLHLDSGSAMLVGHTRDLGGDAAGLSSLPPLWAAWIGVIALGIGVGVAFGAGRGLTGITVAVMLCTYAVLLLLTPWIGSVAASGAALAILFVAARVLERVTGSIPATTTFQPAFLLMVPGTVGLVALAAADATAVLTAVATFASLCVGTKVGAVLVQAVPRSR